MLILCALPLFSQIPNTISKEEKVFGLSKFWQEVNYNFVYLNKVDRNEWDSMYKQLISEVQETENDYEYYRLLQKFCAFLKDGHTNVNFPKEIQDNILNTYFGEYRLFLSNIEGKAILTRVNASKKEELPIGTEIIKVNGLPTREYLEQNVIPYISSSTDFIREDWGIQRMLQGYVGTTYELEMQLPNGNIKTLKLTHSKTEEKEVFPPDEKSELLDFKWINKDIVYISLNSFQEWEIVNLFTDKLPELKKAKKLIIDLRKNGGGDSNIARETIKYLTKDTIIYGSKTQSRLHIPTYKAWGKWAKETDTLNNPRSKQSYLSFRDEYYYDFPYSPYPLNFEFERVVIPTVLLIGHNTASAAEDFLIYADNQKHMTKIGEPTFGSTGQPMYFELLGNDMARICTKKDMYPDGKEFVGYGIQPNIEVEKTLTDYLENKDPVLAKAVEFLTERK